jgi:hypothetical protein
MPGENFPVGALSKSSAPARAYRTPTVAELRARIDAGASGDKVPGLDPAAAPLGTDDEAAGTPADRQRVSAALRDEAPDRDQKTPRGFTPTRADSIAPDADPARPRGIWSMRA